MWLHAINYRDRDLRERRTAPLLHRAWIIHWGGQDKPRSVRFEIAANKSMWIFGGNLRFDGPRAETPIDASLHLGPLHAYWSIEGGRALNRALRVDDMHSREISLELKALDGNRARPAYWTVSWSLWTDPDHNVMCRSERYQHSRWYVMRRGYVHPIGKILDLALGKVNYSVETTETTQAIAWLPEGGYPLDMKLEHATWKRPRSPRATTRWYADCFVVSTANGGPGFCPTGKYSYGDDDGVCGTRPAVAPDTTWAQQGTVKFAAAAIRERVRYRRRPTWIPDRIPAGVIPHPASGGCTVTAQDPDTGTVHSTDLAPAPWRASDHRRPQ